MTESKLERKRFVFSPTILRAYSITRGSQGRNWEQKLKQTPWQSTAYWLAPHGSLSLLSCTTQDHPQWAVTSHIGQAFSSLDHPSSCQVDRKPSQHPHWPQICAFPASASLMPDKEGEQCRRWLASHSLVAQCANIF